jgi:nucleotide-binding universal stress UspA family protein
MDQILVPIDFSKDSINALDYALIIGQKMNANIRLIYIKKEENFHPTFAEDFSSIKLKTAKDYFKILLSEYKNKCKNSTMDYKIREGHIYQEIINQAKYDDAKMIVMGTHGVSGFEEYWVGSNALRVVNNATCPVITIRYGYSPRIIKKIVIPIDISVFSRQKVPYVAEIAHALNAETYVIAVHETKQKEVVSKVEVYARQTYEYLTKNNIKSSIQTIGGENITDVTIDFARKIGAELISTITTQTENTRNLWIGSYAFQMVNHSPIPVMTVRLINVLKDAH